MTHLLCDYFHLTSGPRGRAQILGAFQAKICVFDVKTHFNYVKSKKAIYHWNSNCQQDRMAHLLCKYFHLGAGHWGRIQILGLFWAKISVFDEKTHFNYVKIHENHISQEFKSSAGQNGT